MRNLHTHTSGDGRRVRIFEYPTSRPGWAHQWGGAWILK